MSLYNMVHGHNKLAGPLLQILGVKSPDEFPRFRDCWLHNAAAGTDQAPDLQICVYTRTGGNNRAEHAESNQAIRDMPGFIRDEDDDYDSTFAKWYFKVPEDWVPTLLDAYAKVGDQPSTKERWEEMIRGMKP